MPNVPPAKPKAAPSLPPPANPGAGRVLVPNSPIGLAALEVRRVELPQREAFRSAVGVRKVKDVLLLGWRTPEGVVGWGECAARPDPYFSAEFLDGVELLLERFVVPRLAPSMGYAQLLGRLRRIRGWGFARAAVEFAFHDACRRLGQPTLFDFNPGPALPEVPVGISMGLMPDEATLLRRTETALAQGYRRLKFKISPGINPGWYVQARRRFPQAGFAYDANGSFRPDEADVLVRLADGEPITVEQPTHPGRLDRLAAIRQSVPNLRICLDEDLTSVGNLRVAAHLGLLDEVNLKPGRVGGLYASFLILAEAERRNLPVWVGGMFETGVGRALNLQLAARCPQAKAHDLSPSSRYFPQDLVTMPLDMDPPGYVPTAPYANWAMDPEALDRYTVAHRIHYPPV